MNACTSAMCIHTALEKRASTERLTLEPVPLPERECREKTAMNAKRMLANISPLFFSHFPFLSPSLPITHFLQWLPAEKDLELCGLISFYHPLEKKKKASLLGFDDFNLMFLLFLLSAMFERLDVLGAVPLTFGIICPTLFFFTGKGVLSWPKETEQRGWFWKGP